MSDKKFSLSKKHLGFSLLLIPVVLSALLLFPKNDSARFEQLTENLLTSELAANTLNMHYTVAHPENYGIQYKPILSAYSSGKAEANKVESENLLAALADIAPEHLSDSDAYTYDLLVTFLQNQETGNRLYLYDEPLSPSSGAQSGLPILLADYTFRSAADVDDYLAILSQTDQFLAGLITFEQEKANAGLFMSDTAAWKVIEQCDNIMDKNQLAAGSHFLQSTFEERVNNLKEDGILSDQQVTDYIAENNRLLTTVMEPAYTQTGDDLLVLKGKGTNSNGLYYFPDGRDYYKYLLKKTTGSYRDIEEIKKLLYDHFEDAFDALVALAAANPDMSEKLKQKLPAMPFNTPEEGLENLQQMMAENYPMFPLTQNDDTPVHTVKYVSPAMEPYCSPAYYLTPPFDDFEKNTIYVNGKNNPEGLILYTTLAHEGYPGHLYQTVYSLLHMQQSDANLSRHILHYGGYVEGWAFYVEMDAYSFARQIMADTAPETAYLYEYYRLNRSLQLCIYSLLDIAIHYEGADFPRVQKILATVGITDDKTIQNIFHYIVEEPTTYLKYYLGYLEILQLKEKAQTLWGADFTPYKFHQFFLDAGASDFMNLEKRLNKYNLPK